MHIRIENPPIKTYLRSRPRLPIFDSFLDVPPERQPVPLPLTVNLYVNRPLFSRRAPSSFSGGAPGVRALKPCLLSELSSTWPASVRVICATVSAIVLRAVRLDNGQPAPACSRCSLPQTDRRTLSQVSPQGREMPTASVVLYGGAQKKSTRQQRSLLCAKLSLC